MTSTAAPDERNDAASRVDGLRRLWEMSDAEAVARDALTHSPGDSNLWVSLGRVFLSTDRAGSALDAFTKAGQLTPADDRPTAWQIAALSNLRRYDEAVCLARK